MIWGDGDEHPPPAADPKDTAGAVLAALFGAVWVIFIIWVLIYYYGRLGRMTGIPLIDLILALGSLATGVAALITALTAHARINSHENGKGDHETQAHTSGG
jgi:hypothetical protein